MATIAENKSCWNDTYAWNERGDEWSACWGSSEFQWYGTLYLRIHAFFPAHTILEIAPGYGRWTQFLKEHCQHLVLVDLSARCIEACQKRFTSDSHLSYHVNDGTSLAMIADESVDFVFSFDSLVHVERDVMNAYLIQLARKLKPDGIGFIHHSNLGDFERYFSTLRKLPRGRNFLSRLGLTEPFEHWRALSVSAGTFEIDADKAGLQCISQEKIPWVGMKRPTDCLSTFTRKGSTFARPNRIVWNKDFMREAQRLSRLSKLYSWSAVEV